MRRSVLSVFAVTAALLLLTRPVPVRSEGRAPNIVVFLADDLGWNDVGYHGSQIRTPNIDALAASGVRLDQFYVLPVCSPTRVALMTGRYPMRMGLQNGVINGWDRVGVPLEERTLAQALKERGYQTAVVGKWHLGHFEESYLPMARGFDHQYGFYNGEIGYNTHRYLGGLDWHRDEEALVEKGYSTSLITSETVRLIRQRDRSQPFFLYVAFNAPHGPLEAPKAYLARYAGIHGAARRRFAAMVSCMDDGIGAIQGELRNEGLSNDTLVVFASDNGGNTIKGGSNLPLRAGKHSLYEGGVRVPAIVSWPGHLPAGAAAPAPMHVVDLYPTLLAEAGGAPAQPLPLDGKDAWPVLTGMQTTLHDDILLNVTPYQGALRSGSWKLILTGALPRPAGKAARGTRAELYDLSTDPEERVNVAASRPEKVQELWTRLDGYARQSLHPKTSPHDSPPSGFRPPRIWGE